MSNHLNRNDGWGIRSRDQVTVAALTIVGLLAIAGSWLYRGGLSGRLIEIDNAAKTEVTFEIDINAADWPEWTLLPGVGEKMAKRIVQDRKQRGNFLKYDDLSRVNGIGPRTIERMRPYLLPISPNADLQQSKPSIRSVTNTQ